MIRTALTLIAAAVLLTGCLTTTVVKGTAKVTGAVVKGTVKGGVAVGKAVIPGESPDKKARNKKNGR